MEATVWRVVAGSGPPPPSQPRWGMQGRTCNNESQVAPGLGPVACPAGRSQSSTSWFQSRHLVSPAGWVSLLASSTPTPD